MKKYLVICAAVAVALAGTSCKSSESAYKKAYEKARAVDTQASQQVETVIQQAPVETVVQQVPVQTVQPVEEPVQVRQESVTLVNGQGLKAYSVVVGSFGVKPNADRLVSELKSKGYDAQLVSSGSYYRVVASTSDDKASSVQARNRLMNEYPGAWLLLKK